MNENFEKNNSMSSFEILNLHQIDDGLIFILHAKKKILRKFIRHHFYNLSKMMIAFNRSCKMYMTIYDNNSINEDDVGQTQHNIQFNYSLNKTL